MTQSQATFRVQWVRSGIAFSARQKTMIRSLGLRRLHHIVELPDTPHTRGLVTRLAHLVRVVEPPEGPAAARVPEYTVRPRIIVRVEPPLPEGEPAAAGDVEAGTPGSGPAAGKEKAAAVSSAGGSSGAEDETARDAPPAEGGEAGTAPPGGDSHPSPED